MKSKQYRETGKSKKAQMLDRNRRLTLALLDLVQWCEDNFVSEESGPDLTEARKALDFDKKAGE